MTDDRSLERAARSWIEAGPSRAPDHVVEAALLSIQTTPQERSLRAPWRLTTMPTTARVAAAAAIGVLVLGGALLILGRQSPSVGNPPPTPSATAASASPAFVGVGPLAAGPYRVVVGDVGFIFTIPDGWAGPAVPGFAVGKEGDGELASVILSFWQPASIYPDPCSPGSLLDPSVGPSVDDLVAALAAQSFTETSAPTPVTVDGFSGQRIQYDVTPDSANCTGSMWLWRDTDGSDRTEDHDQLNELTILDVAGSRVVIDLSYRPETPQHDRAELDSVFQTIQIEP